MRLDPSSGVPVAGNERSSPWRLSDPLQQTAADEDAPSPLVLIVVACMPFSVLFWIGLGWWIWEAWS